jgi:hypothetical protein
MKSIIQLAEYLLAIVLYAEATKCRQGLADKNAKKITKAYVLASNFYGCKR